MGWYVELVAEQQGIDIALKLDELVIDSPNGAWGPEPLVIYGRGEGPLHLRVTAAFGPVRSGRYRLRVKAHRPALPADRAHVAAEHTLAAAEALRRRGDPRSLTQAVTKATRAAREFGLVGRARRRAHAFFSVGRSYLSLARYSHRHGGTVLELSGPEAAGKACEALRQSLTIFRALDDERLVGRVLGNLGQAHDLEGETSKAIASYVAGLEALRAPGDQWEASMARHNLGRVYASIDAIEQALDAYEQARDGFTQLGDQAHEGVTLSSLGQLYITMGEPRRGLDHLNEALPMLRAAGLRFDEGVALARLGVARGLAGEPRSGISPLRQALKLHTRLGKLREQAVTLNDLGWLWRRLGDTEAAAHSYRRALDLLRQLDDRPSQAIVGSNLGAVELDRNRPADALIAFEEALGHFRSLGQRRGEAAAQLGLAIARRNLGDPSAALTPAREAISLVESVRDEPDRPALRTSFLASKQSYYSFYVDLLMQLHALQPDAGHDVQAFEVTEARFARTLLDGLDGAASTDRENDARQAEFERQVDILDRRRGYLAENGAPAARQLAVELELRNVLGLIERTHARRQRAGERGSEETEPRPLNLRQIRSQVLDGETTLLAFSLGERRSFLWLVSADELQSFELPPRVTIEKAARRAARLIAAGDHPLARTQTTDALSKLSGQLLSPAIGQLGERLLIVPDGALHYVPFAALPTPTPEGANPAPPLVEHYEIVIAPSASVLAALRGRESHSAPESTLAVLADPVFSADDSRVEASAQTERPSPDEGLPRLVHSRQEAEAILDLVPPGESLAAFDFAARRQLISGGDLASFRIIHLATHGLLDTENPEMSGLVFSQVDRWGRPLRGILRAYEVRRLKLTADLVVLSGCRTAMGREIRGEGLLGLTQAFFHAGARRLLVSLWQVEDRATAKLMRHFYARLLVDGEPPAAALRAAQLSLAREKSWQHPYYWAAFELQGDWLPP